MGDIMTGRTTARKTPGERAVADILGGRCDADLMEVLNAINRRATGAAVARRWRVSLDGTTLTEDDLTLDEAVEIEELTGTTWASISPLNTAAHCRAILRVMLTRRAGLSEADADARLGKATVTEIMGSLELYGVQPAPFDSESAPTT